ncbi:MAG: TolC family protein [Pirellulaceae bacterium]|nr:TolC family protein [Pirellulaceae bacterium]
MSRQSSTHVAFLLIALTVFSGCHPTQPFFFHEDGDLSHLLNHATDLEYPDVQTASLPDAAESGEPLTISNPQFDEIWDVELEECIVIALQNSKTIRNLGGVTPFGFADGLLSRSGQTTVYDPAITESSPSSIASNSALQGPGTQLQRVTAAGVGGAEAALADFDALLRVQGVAPGTANGIYSRSNRPVNSSAGAAGIFPGTQDQDDAGLRSEIIKKTAYGSRVSIANLTNYTRFNNGTKGFRELSNEWTTSLEARIDMPILRGRGTMINRIPVVLARINEDISLAQFESSVRNLVLDIENTYWDLHNAYRNLETAKIGRDSAQVTWKIVYEKWLGEVAPIQDEAQAREQYFFFRSAVETALRQLYETETKLRFLMGLAATDGRLIRPIDEPTMAKIEFDWRAIRTETLARSPELRQQKWGIKQRELELISAKNQLLPKLDLGLVYRWVGRGNDLINANRNGLAFPAAGSTAFESLTTGDFQEFAAIVDFALPIGFRRELTGVRNAQLQLARAKAQLEDQELNSIHLLTTAIRNLDGNYTLAQSHFNRWSASEKEVESAEALYQGGKTTLDRVLDAQQRRAQAQADFYRALSDYSKSIAEVHFRKGSLLEYNNVQLAEGPWPQKAYWDALARARERDASYYLDFGWTRPNVVSRGPVPEGVMDVPMEEIMPAEHLMPSGPTPAEPQESESAPDVLPVPEAGPVTERSMPLMLNAPVIQTANKGHAAATTPDNPLRPQSFQWGSIGLDDANPIRQRDSSVRQASFVGEIDDAD